MKAARILLELIVTDDTDGAETLAGVLACSAIAGLLYFVKQAFDFAALLL